jgi:pilus assembly protein CpaB
MSPVRLIILLVAAGAAIGAVFLVRAMQQPAPAVAAVPTEPRKPATFAKQILVAKAAIPVGKFIVADDLKWQGWPDNASTGSFVDQKANPEGLEKMVGAVARFDLVEGEPITATKLVHPGDSSFMAAMLSPGTRAMTIEIAPETAAGGFIQPGDRVDVLVTREIENVQGSANTMENYRSDLILANVRVLAIDGVYGPPASEGQAAILVGSRATLELNARDTTLINAAERAGALSLSLRSIADLQAPQGATATGRVYRDGVAQGAEGVRVYRYGNETVAAAPAG